MRTFKLSSRLLTALLAMPAASGLALAADLPVKARPIDPVIAYNWTGIYGGVYGGYGGGMKDWGGINLLAKGAFGGLTIGVNQQVGNFVVGLEGDYSWAGIRGRQDETIAVPFSVSNFDASIASDIDRIGTFAARLGFAQDRWLVYIKGGVGYAHETHSQVQRSTITGITGAQTVSISGQENRYGPMVGFGAEYAFLGNWSVKAEYNLFDFYGNGTVRETGTLTSFAGVTSNVATTVNVRQQLHFAKIGLNYRFGPAGTPEVKPSRPAPGYDWTGVYLGVEGGGGAGRTAFIGFAPFDAYRPNGWFGGAVAGVNAQAGVFVAGVEAEWMGGRMSGGRDDITSVTVSGTSTQSLATKIDSIAMATARMGFVAWDRWLVYGKAGIALAHENHTNNFAFNGIPTVTSSTFLNSGQAYHTGVVMGAGTEWAFLGNWSAKLEYNYIRFRAQDVFLPGTITEISPVLGTGTTSLPNSASLTQDIHLVKVGLNYRFGPEVIVARY